MGSAVTGKAAGKIAGLEEIVGEGLEDVVEGILADIASGGDRAVRELSIRFDGWDRADYRLTDAEIRDCLGQLSGQAISAKPLTRWPSTT